MATHDSTRPRPPAARAPLTPMQRLGWPVKDWAAAAGIGRSTIYELISEGSIKSVKFRSKRLIITSPAEWLQSLRGAA